MGTNYYLHRKIPQRTKQRIKSLVSEEFIYNGQLQQVLDDFQPIHIGKSSKGWQFLFNHNNWKYYEGTKASINAFLNDEIIKGGKIVDNYGAPITLKDLWDTVESHKDGWDGKAYYEYELERWREYQINPDKFKDDFFKPCCPTVWSTIFPETISDGLRFSDSTDFC